MVSIQTVVHGAVVGAPVEVQTDEGVAAVFVLAPNRRPSLTRQLSGSGPAVCEVWCRQRQLATAVMKSLRGREAVVLRGALWLEQVVGPLEDDLSATRVRIEADSIGIELAS
jgi:hypothetical protein